MDVVWGSIAKGFEEDAPIIKAAYAAFDEKWVELGFPSIMDWTPDDTDKYNPRTPDTAIGMLEHYVPTRRRLISGLNLLAIEQPFAVPLTEADPDLWYCGRLDKVYEAPDGVYIVDHKTTAWYKKDGFFRSEFIDGFSPDSQIDGYAYAAHMLYGDRFKGVFIDGALVHKNVHEGFCWIPVARHIDQLDAWLWETQHKIKRMEANKGMLGNYAEEMVSGDMSYMPAFEKNTGSCFSFNTPCPYLDLCKSWGNPHDAILSQGTPMGFEVEPWSPFDHIQLEKIGFKREDVG
jgi:hypothetical protein